MSLIEQTAMSWLADICLAPMTGYFLLVPKRCVSPEVLQARRLVVRALPEICLHAYDGLLDALAVRPIIASSQASIPV
ncbi:hypothetical protein IVB18_39765 [Bradyrhizobium sp. 186]|uniref:hypothetical protein n=1 Tax=Bradyrhizobium sp. 186 TaxID=2782654 RepID=UPI002001C14D|nr:hypothetical protein [Bradyrhizobium sp. 186]UPK34219.1 hypothetical protein IVB18_39765 [Bradyrhizobium sp. 186]